MTVPPTAGPGRRGWTHRATLAVIALPVAVAAIEATRFHIANRSNAVLVSSGVEREYLLYVPESYDSTTPTPLVISLHGGALWGAAQREISGWNEVADRHGFIVAYPWGTEFPRMWHAVEPGARLRADVGFIADLIDSVRAAYNIDAARIYANGLSNGAGMAFVLSCTMPDRIAAVGLVAAANFLPFSWCPDTSAVPAVAFHGTDDRLARYEGGRSWVAPTPFANIPGWMADWARRNGCAPDPVDSRVARDVVRRTWPGCTGDRSVVLYTVEEGGHTWPGDEPTAEWFLGGTTSSIVATSVMWTFFREYSLVLD